MEQGRKAIYKVSEQPLREMGRARAAHRLWGWGAGRCGGTAFSGEAPTGLGWVQGVRARRRPRCFQDLSFGGGLCCLQSVLVRTVSVIGLTTLTVSTDPPPRGCWRPWRAHPLDLHRGEILRCL